MFSESMWGRYFGGRVLMGVGIGCQIHEVVVGHASMEQQR